ncbi:MAG: glycosyltransferase family 4 protein [bacterium]|nr:glycosyltransferase family 4 protein [bacterium]
MHITHVFPRFKEIHGGAEPVIFNLLRCLCDQGIRNTLVTSDFPGILAEQLDPRVGLITPPRALSLSFKNVLLAGFANLATTFVLPFFFPRRSDVVCFHTETVVPALALQTLLGRPQPTIYFCYQPPRFAYDTTTDTSRSGGFLGRLVPIFAAAYRPCDRAAVRRADEVFTFSTGYGEWIQEIYGIEGVKVVPPGVQRPEKVPPLPPGIAAALEGKGPVLCFTGKLIPWKNVDRLINITGLLKRQFPDIACLVVGDGPSMGPLKEQVERMGLTGNVLFPGYVGPDEVFSFYDSADLFVILEQNISFGLCLVEANASGVPVIAFRAGGPLDIIVDGENGFLIPPDAKDEEISARIGNILNAPTALNTMKEKALKAAGRFTWEGFADRFRQLACSTLQGEVR